MKRCPECAKDNKDDARGCAFCPATFPDPDAPPQQNRFKRFDPGSWPIVYWIAIFVGCGMLTWKGFDVIMSVGAEGMKNPLMLVNRKMESMGRDTDIVKSGIHVGIEQQHASTPTYTVNGQAPAKVEMNIAPPKEVQKREPQPGDWRLSGTVYDLVTLQPVANCGMVFKSKGGRGEAVTDESGHYDLAVPPPHGGGGYTVEIAHPGYARSYLNPAAEKVRDMPAEERAGLAKDLATSDGGQYPVEAAGSDSLTTDFYLAPKG